MNSSKFYSIILIALLVFVPSASYAQSKTELQAQKRTIFQKIRDALNDIKAKRNKFKAQQRDQKRKAKAAQEHARQMRSKLKQSQAGVKRSQDNAKAAMRRARDKHKDNKRSLDTQLRMLKNR